jgi:hypothetical protein
MKPVNGVVAVVLLMLAGVAAADAQSPVREVHRLNVTAQDGARWQEASSMLGSFSIRMPVPFNDYTLRAEQVRHVIDGKSTDGIAFSVVEFPKKTSKGQMDGIYDDLGNSPLKTSAMNRAKRNGADILSFGTYGGVTSSYAQYVETDTSFYFVTIVYPPGLQTKVEAVKDEFFRSFTFGRPAR